MRLCLLVAALILPAMAWSASDEAPGLDHKACAIGVWNMFDVIDSWMLNVPLEKSVAMSGNEEAALEIYNLADRNGVAEAYAGAFASHYDCESQVQPMGESVSDEMAAYRRCSLQNVLRTKVLFALREGVPLEKTLSEYDEALHGVVKALYGTRQTYNIEKTFAASARAFQDCIKAID